MKTIEIRNVGPLVETGKIVVSQIMLLVGKQSTGKSTFMKILCFCSWIEKQIMIDEKNALYKYTHYYRFWNEMKKFHHFNEDFLNENSYVRYEGESVQIEMKGRQHNVKITVADDFQEKKHNIKLCFLPSERNLLAAIQNVESLYRSREVDMLFNYILEWGEARSNFDASNPLDLVFVDDMRYHYDSKSGDVLTLSGGHSRIKPYYASSGVQSALPIQVLATYMASTVGTSARISPMEYLTHMLGNEWKIDEKSLSLIVQELRKSGGAGASQKSLESFPLLERAFNDMKDRLQYKSFHMFIEELEQNLFPDAQFDLIKMLIGLVVKAGQKLPDYSSSIFLTTHSPYVLTALNVMMLVSEAFQKDSKTVASMGFEPYVLPLSSYSAYCIENGRFENIVDEEHHFIKGDYLDSISDRIDGYTYELNNVIYGDIDRQA